MNSRNTKLKPFAIFGGLIASLLLFSGIIISHAFTDHLSLGKTFFYFFTLSFLCAWFFIQHIFLPGKKSISFNLTDVLMCFFTVYILIRVFTTPSISMLHHSFIIFGGYVVIYFIVRNVFSMYSNHEKSQEDFLYAFMLLALMVFIVQIVAGFLQLSGVMEGYHKLFAVTGFFHNPGPFAIFLTGLSPFILGFILLKYPFAFFRYLAWACLGGFLVLLVISKSRSAWIAFTIGLIFFIYYTGVYPLSIKKWLTKPSNKILVPGIALLFIIISGYGLFHLKKESVLGRAFVWKITLHAIADKPVFGSGFSQFQKTHNDYQATYFRQGKGTEKEINMATDDPYAYNEYIQMACELGMIGLILFILFILSLFIHRPLESNNKHHKIRGIAKTSVLIVSISALFSYPFHVIPIAVILFIAAGIISGLNNNTIFSITIPVKYIRLTSVVGFILVFMFMHYQYKQLHAYKNWKKGYDLLRAGKVNAGLQVYNKLHEPLRHDGSFLFNYGSELSILNRHKKSAKVLNETIALLNVADVYTYLGNSYEGMEQYNRAIAAFEQSSYIIPHKFYPKYRLLPLYFGTGQKRKAIELARSMLHTEPKVPSKIVDKIKYDVRGFLEKYE
jgi:O-antigen ligase